ncbi:hypothetical protein FHS18_004196 [Paenibacillus phyllosphaerae]|uniref:Uncharacterized protein n=1 Tax=Paenibacillus phyllosphaerae TaxID=274593 RepID=A0A7W5B0I6_9BACL|nr:hypothetical protein [Paenibacillus phyllosphaerae]MBB3112118.1 hypothetical protein [Paenibacillus phyllosphaerae]
MSLIHLNHFIESGYYEQLKECIKYADKLKDRIRDKLDNQEIDRYVWEENGVVGKFRILKRYRYDHANLHEYLFNYGLLPVTTSIKTELLFDHEKKILKEAMGDELTKEIQVRFHRDNKSDIPSRLNRKTLEVSQISTSDCVQLWMDNKRVLDILTKQWNLIKSAIGDCYSNGDNREVRSEHGRLTIRKKYIIPPLNVLGILGEEALLRSAYINTEKLEEYAVRGFLSKLEINKFRQVTSINRQFLLMELEVEKKVEAWLSRRREKLMKISMNK